MEPATPAVLSPTDSVLPKLQSSSLLLVVLPPPLLAPVARMMPPTHASPFTG
jgi:hypothetical protein